MAQKTQNVLIGNTPIKGVQKETKGRYLNLFGETYYQIQNFDAIPPFFISLVSSSDHWFFISSTGGLSAGRKNIERALFPYYTEDKLSENSENTGAKTIFLVNRENQTWVWEPFSIRQIGAYSTERNLYKNIAGTTLIFEEINHDLALTFRYAWRTSEKFGFVKTSWLSNDSSTASTSQVEVLDGIQNILPANVSSSIQVNFSCLQDAYKRSELEVETGLGIFVLNSIVSDRAEPSESFLATTVFQVGLEGRNYLLSSLQLDQFRRAKDLATETEIRGQRSAYFVQATLDFSGTSKYTWHIVADVCQDGAEVVKTLGLLKKDHTLLYNEIEEDTIDNTAQITEIVASSDGLQLSENLLSTSHHFANTLFNVMRGGIFSDQYRVDKNDLLDFVATHSKKTVQTGKNFFIDLPDRINILDLYQKAKESNSPDLVRLCQNYLPLTFSRRHGDPSRPWNRFEINIKKEDGSKKLDYAGNWRDIFQNWEALAYSYPDYIEGMISTFLCATTADGYNPYRIMRAGVDWEVVEPDNPWSNIGYWNDHQIIYLLKLMELSEDFHPKKLSKELDRRIYCYSNIPYRIKPYEDLVRDPHNTIDFDHQLEKKLENQVSTEGSDGKLIHDSKGNIIYCSLAEKLINLLLAKLVNFVPEGGIWMNTQRPEWNDANNALVGKGLSVVTLGYLRRYIAFCRQLFAASTDNSLNISTELKQLLSEISDTFAHFQFIVKNSFNDNQRRAMLDELGKAGSDFRWNLYENGFSGEFQSISKVELIQFLDLTQSYIEQSLRANKREDGLYHAYNILHFENDTAMIGRMYEMLEGQVSILSSGLLSAEESLELLDGLRNGRLFSPERHTYILYPDRILPSVLEKNRLAEEQLKGLRLPEALSQAQDKTLLIRDVEGDYHFSGNIRNGKDIQKALQELASQPQYTDLVSKEGKQIADLFEHIFRHSEFTGRSGTFFAYEGLGSVYWHMVSKLLLAAQETTVRFQDSPLASHLREKYYDIRSGLGFNKSPADFGAFPTDPYSHTPKGQGARQPGMTGVVKEELLTRWAEVGLAIKDGCLIFKPFLVDEKELVSESGNFKYIDIQGMEKQIDLPVGSLAFTICQVPVIVKLGAVDQIEVLFNDRSQKLISANKLDMELSSHIFTRDGVVNQLTVILQKP